LPCLKQSRAKFASAQYLLEVGQLTDDDIKQIVKRMDGSFALTKFELRLGSLLA
jgi:hypothetical protein